MASVSAEAVNAVFGVAEVHEDDALRALHAAPDIHARLAGLSHELPAARTLELEVRIGMRTGEVVVGGAAATSLLVTGVPFVTARTSRMGPSRATPSSTTRRLELTGRRIEGDGTMVAGGQPSILARVAEPLQDLASVRRWSDENASCAACATRTSRRSTTVRVSSSRFSAGGSRKVPADRGVPLGSSPRTHGRGSRTLPAYGDGITFWPVLEAVQQAAGLDDVDSPERDRS